MQNEKWKVVNKFSIFNFQFLIKIFGYMTLILIAVSMLYPFFTMVNLSFVENGEIFLHPEKFFHVGLTWKNYENVFSSIPISAYFLNS